MSNSYPNTLIYECSSTNASVQIAPNEFINEFKEGIELMPGDTIRILGSFINEKGSGDQIEITEENNKFTLEYIPIHNLYQYTKLSDDYVKPNDPTRTKVDKAQFSSILNVDTPRYYDGNGSPMYLWSFRDGDTASKADRWYDEVGFSTYNNISGYQNVNPNTQYYDCELIKNIACPHVDGVRLEWWDSENSSGESPTFYYQEIDFDSSGMPWGGPLSPYGGDGPSGLEEKQLAFSSQWISFKWNGQTGTNTSFEMELKKPFGVTGKLMGLKYSVNPVEYTDPYTGQNFPKGTYPICTFMVGDHTIQTKTDPTSINPTGDNADDMGKGFNFDIGTTLEDFDRAKNNALYNANNGPVDITGRTWGLDTEIDIMFSGFTTGLENKADTTIMYDFYCTGPNPNTGFETNGDDTSTNQSTLSDRCGIYYNSTTEKYYYQIRLKKNESGLTDIREFLDEYYISFLRAYDPNSPSSNNISNRLYLPISLVENELGFQNNQDTGTPVSKENIGLGIRRQYNSTQADLPNAPTTGGMKLGNWGFSELGPSATSDDYFTMAGDKFQQTIKPGFQTNVTMCGDTILTLPDDVDMADDPVANLSRKAGGFPSVDYANQLQDILDYKQDCYLIQSKKVNYEIPTGFYTTDRLANVINDLLHLNKEQYNNEIGKGQCTNSNKDDNWCYAPSNNNGPFVMTKIPEINGGIIPPDLSEDNLNNPSLSNRPPGITLDSTKYVIYTQTIINDSITAKNLASGILDGSALYTDKMSDKYIDTKQMIFCPLPPSKIPNSQVYADEGEPLYMEFNSDLFSSNNGDKQIDDGIYTKWYDACNKIAEREVPIFMGQGTYTASGQVHDYSGTDFRPDATGELGEGLIQRVINQPQGNMTYLGTGPTLANDDYFYGFPIFATFNRTWGGFVTGGLTRFFSGANDLTFSFDEDEERFSFSQSYTPFRPAGFESSKDKSEFTVDDSVPSVLINTLYNGYNLYATTQLYILSLAAPPVCTFASNVDDRQGPMPVVKNPNKQQAGAIDLWNSLGFTGLPTYTETNGVYNITASRWIDDVYFQENLDINYGTKPIYNIADINPSANASNPAKSQCLITFPNRQFLIQTISDEVKSENPASLTTYPFYLIGSSIPSGFYHGSTTGTELPVVGLCSRNFSAGSFVFDLSQSSVEWTIGEKITLNSIRTKILKNDFTPATNLFGNSSVVYAVTKNNYYKQLPDQEAENMEKQREKQIEKETKEILTQVQPIQPSVQYMIPSVPFQQLINTPDTDDESDASDY